MYRRTGRVHFAIAPSQRLEAKVPIDAQITSAFGGGVLIQYKRAYVSGHRWTWHLNRTAGRDQHRRLQRMQQRGFSVFYAFPFFSTIEDLARYRRRLLRHHTFLFRPLGIRPLGGPTGHHDVTYDLAADRWTVSSPERTLIDESVDLEEIAEEVEKAVHVENLERLISAFNEEFLVRREGGVYSRGRAATTGTSIVGRTLPMRKIVKRQFIA
jgi:hypothetical protein